LINPTYRIATEVGPPLPDGTQLLPDGRLAGKPSAVADSNQIIVTAEDSSGAGTSMYLDVDNCDLIQRGDVYLIGSVENLDSFRLKVCGRDASYEQTADIHWHWSEPWSDVTTEAEPFTGVFDGAGHTITGLVMSGNDYSAFIARALGAEIRDLSIQGESTGRYGTSGLVGYGKDTVISGVSVDMNIGNSTETNSDYNGDYIFGCHGAIAGELDGSSRVTRSAGLGIINTPTADWVGGLVGCTYDGTVIEESYYNGEINGRAEVGGLIGWAASTTLRDSYVVGSISSTLLHIGGLAGYSGTSTSTFTNNYASVAVTGVTSIGGILGKGVDHSFVGSTWESGLLGPSSLDPIGTLDTGAAQPDVSAQLEPTMKNYVYFQNAGWQIEESWIDPAVTAKPWGICDGQTRPFLQWQYSASNAPCALESPTTEDGSGGQTTDPDSGSGTSSGDTPNPAMGSSSQSSVAPPSDSSSTTGVAPATAINDAGEAAVGRSRATSTSRGKLPTTGITLDGFATFALWVVLVGSAGVIATRRRNHQHRSS
jgi:LPXTG-motif cell wall-anchored protein